MPQVDLHAHILPGLDDGPESMDASVEMALSAAADGTEIIVATPHQRDVMLNSSAAEVRQLGIDLNSRLRREAANGRPRARVLLGMENHIEPDLPDWVDQGLALTLNGTRFILAEPPFTGFPRYVEDVLARLRMKRLVPVLAHPERNVVLQKHPGRLEDLMEDGILVQVTAGSFVGEFGPQAQRAAEAFLRRNLIHAIASDMHGPGSPRSPKLSAAFTRVSEIAGSDRARSLFEVQPLMMLEGHSPERELTDIEPESHGWWPRLRPRLRRRNGIDRG